MNNALLAFCVFLVDSSEWTSLGEVLSKRHVPDERGVAAGRRVPLEYELRSASSDESDRNRRGDQLQQWYIFSPCRLPTEV